MKTNKKYDVVFNTETMSNCKGFEESLKYCRDYIKTWNGSNISYFEDYKGGTVSIVDINSGETVFETTVK